MKLSVSQDFTQYPYGRYRSDGDYCGEVFRENKLIPAFEHARKQKETLEVSLEGVQILGDSFLDESFGGLVRKLTKKGISFDFIIKTVKITAESPVYNHFVQKAEQHMRDALLEKLDG